MAENENENIQQDMAEEKAILKAYKELQENSVPKERHLSEINALKEKNAIYLKAITEGENVDVSDETELSIEAAIGQVSNYKGTNLGFWDKMTKTIDTVLKKTPEQEITRIAGSDGLEDIVKVNETMKTLVRDAGGDPDYFRTLYKQRITDSAPRISAEIEKKGGLVNYLNAKQK